MKIQNFILAYFRSKISLLSLISKKAAADVAFTIFCTPYGKIHYTPTTGLLEAEQLQLTFNKIQAKGYRWNKGGLKKILIAHGFRSGAVNFEHIARKLAADNFEVVAFDAPAHGLSGGKKINAIDYKNFIETLNNTYGPFDGYVAHSFGGLAVSLAVAEIPHNHSILIALIAPASNTASLIDYYFDEIRLRNKKVQHYFLDKIQTLGGKEIEWYSIKRCADTIHGPVLWIHDREDNITPAKEAYEVEDCKFANFRFIFTNGLGHRRIYRDLQVIEQVADFLKGLPHHEKKE